MNTSQVLSSSPAGRHTFAPGALGTPSLRAMWDHGEDDAIVLDEDTWTLEPEEEEEADEVDIGPGHHVPRTLNI